MIKTSSQILLLSVALVLTNGLRISDPDEIPRFSESQIEALCNQELDAHNAKRALHAASDLKLCPELSKEAQDWAEEIADGCHRHKLQRIGEIGQSIYVKFFSDYEAGDATRTWYDEINEYDFENPKFESKTGHFTQLVWKNSERVGFGFAQHFWSTVVVAFYSPAGNVEGQFEANVEAAQQN